MNSANVTRTFKPACQLSLLAMILCAPAPRLRAQTPAPVSPAWSQPGSATHAQVAPPPDFHRPSRTFDTPIGVFEGQSDIGGAVIPGSASFDPATRQYTIHSAGYNVWYNRDEFRYLWKKMSGDISLAADIAYPDPNGYGDRKAVLVIRQSLDDDSKEAIVALHGAGMVHLAQRPEKNVRVKDMEYRIGGRGLPGGASPDSLVNVVPGRIGIEKRGDSFALFVSAQGEPMHQFGAPIDLHLDGPFYVGIGFCSHMPDKSDTAVLTNVVLENSAGQFNGKLAAEASPAPKYTLPLWPQGNPEPSLLTGPEFDPTTDSNRIVSGKVTVRVTNVSKPTLAVYSPNPSRNNGAAALVFPGGSYARLAYNIEGTEVCGWLNSLGMTCLLVKYRVPEKGLFPENVEDLEDAQQAMRLARTHAAEWHIDPQRIGAIGFSAGAHLAAVLSTHPGFQGSSVPPSTIDAQPKFQMLLYPGWLNGADGKVNPAVAPTSATPPTFLAMAENDYTAHVENALVYFGALKDAKVPAELHLFTQGGHGFGLRPTELPISGWPALAETWLHTIHILGPAGVVGLP